MKTKEAREPYVRKHPDVQMTPAQIARRKFKSLLPRKLKNRTLSPMQALAQTLGLLDTFMGMVCEEKQSMDAAKTIYAAIAYKKENAPRLAYTIGIPEPGQADNFYETVLALEAEFLGVVFIQVDFDTDNPAYQAVSFVVPFMTGSDAEARLVYAQKEELTKIRAVTSGLGN